MSGEWIEFLSLNDTHHTYRDPVRGKGVSAIALRASKASHAAPGEDGAEEKYDLSDALGKFLYFDASQPSLMVPAVASWLNVFVRKADVVKIACIAQYVALLIILLILC